MLFNIKILFICIWLCGISVHLNSQSTIQEDINTEFIGEAIFMFKVANGAFVYNFLKDSTIHDGPILRAYHTETEITPSNHQNYDNEILDAGTLRPLRKYFGDNKSIYFNYDVPGVIEITTHSRTDTVYTTLNVNDFAFVINGPGSYLLPQALPLNTGYKTEFIGIENLYGDPSKIATLGYSLEVIGQENIKHNLTDYECYVVEIKSHERDRGFYAKFWTRIEKPHITIKSLFTLMKYSDDPDPRFTSIPWRIIEQ